MTRINCIPVTELTDKHLIAEYRELPRVFKLARECPEAPKEYTLGKGHAKFFYDKLLYLLLRQEDLISEMQQRGFKPAFTKPYSLMKGKPASLCNDWNPGKKAMELNRARIAERLLAARSR